MRPTLLEDPAEEDQAEEREVAPLEDVDDDDVWRLPADDVGFVEEDEELYEEEPDNFLLP